MKSENLVRASTFLEVICAAHISSYVESPYESFGGVMLVGPPEALKTSFLSVLDRYPNALVLSDLNIKTLTAMRQDISAGQIRTLALTEIRKLYERNIQTAANIEGHIRALVDEGFRAASFQDQRVRGFTARCMVMAGMTEKFYMEHFEKWSDSGFSRRFLWCIYRLKDPNAILRAIEKWTKLDVGTVPIIEIPASGVIQNAVSDKERQWILTLLKFQTGGKVIPFQLMSRILATLRWHYKRTGDKRDPIDTLKEFAIMLSRDGGMVVV